ncbi:hypothetical protein RHGRI_011839 [Rhododendron griersonianum]|uniref:Uncharacterized protein n=1 Tax=Rhododendron griersonianum TaxID=479676 RepID=A0AAV6KNB9_9ERIC|nr:hypothetical protein RHGRI_011839 [Rhododendron griersonianum]
MAELQMQDIKNVIVHNLSASETYQLFQAKFFINVLAEPAEVVAESLVPSIRSIPANGSTKSTYIRFLTGLKAYSQIFSVKDSHLVLGGIAMCLKIDETYRSDMSVLHFP